MKNNNIYQKIIVVTLLILVVFWLYLFLTHTTSGKLNYLYSFLFGLIPFFAGIIGMLKAKLWGGLNSALGKAVFFISAGLFLWGFGENIWSYYNFFKDVPAPYPSLADIGFAPSIFFWILGVVFLSKATGAWYSIKKHRTAKLFALLMPIILLIPSYFIQVKLARNGILIPEDEPPLKLFLDIIYPFGDFLALTLAAGSLALSYKYFGGQYRNAILSILAGLGIMYVGDSVFAYTTTKATYYNANWGDLVLTLGLFFLAYGVLAFATNPTFKDIKIPPKVL